MIETIIINPGSGPVSSTTEENAINNINHYITDCNLKNVGWVRLPKRDEDGRYGFLIYQDYHCRCHFVDMPGLPLDKVRYMKEEGQNIWDYPRLYLDDSSWVWCFGLLDQEDFEETNDDN